MFICFFHTPTRVARKNSTRARRRVAVATGDEKNIIFERVRSACVCLAFFWRARVRNSSKTERDIIWTVLLALDIIIIVITTGTWLVFGSGNLRPPKKLYRVLAPAAIDGGGGGYASKWSLEPTGRVIRQRGRPCALDTRERTRWRSPGLPRSARIHLFLDSARKKNEILITNVYNEKKKTEKGELVVHTQQDRHIFINQTALYGSDVVYAVCTSNRLNITQ